MSAGWVTVTGLGAWRPEDASGAPDDALLPPAHRRRAKPKRAGLLRLWRRCCSFSFSDGAAERQGGLEFEIE